MSNDSPDKNTDDFMDAASHDKERGLVAEFIGFMAENKKWWLMPVIVFMLSAGALVFLAGSGAAPFIYTLF